MLQFGFDTKLLPPALDEFLGDLTHGVRRSLEKDLERNAVSLSHAVAVRIYDPRIVENLSREIHVLDEAFIVVSRYLGRWSRPDVARRAAGELAVTDPNQGVAVDC